MILEIPFYFDLWEAEDRAGASEGFLSLYSLVDLCNTIALKLGKEIPGVPQSLQATH